MGTSDWAEQVRDGAMKEEEKTTGPLKREDLLSTGSTLLNMALSGSPLGGFLKGKYFYLVGDSSSGKTFFSMGCFAEACRNKNFDKYRLIYDNVEDGMLMDVDRLFGEKAADRIEPPALDEMGEAKFSETIEEFYFNVDNALDEGKPFIYVLDSMDGLSSKDEQRLFKENKKAFQKGRDMAGSYGDGKAKKNSTSLRTVVARLKQTGSILIIISQTRDLLNAGPFQETKTRSGGRALKFYATAEIWTSVGKPIKKTVRGKDRRIGNNIILKVKKNRLTGRESTVTVRLLPSYGVDDVESCIDYLLEEKAWKKSGPVLDAGAFGKVQRSAVVKECETPESMKVLRSEVRACWRAIEEESAVQRKPRYS